MADASNQRDTVLGIVQEVQRRMGYTPSTTLSANRTALKYLGFLNDVVSEISDMGDWPQLYEEVTTTVAACANTVEVNASAPVKRIMEVHEGSQISPLVWQSISQIRLLERLSAQGTPRQVALVNTSGVNPILRYSPRKTSAAGFNIAVYTMPTVYTSGNATETPPFSRALLNQGLYAKALLDENDGVATDHYKASYMLYRNQLREEWNRHNGDTGGDIQLKLRR